jgi:hypothetical protein
VADRAHQIAALRAKAASTTFPAEAEACRAKADELEALEPKPVYEHVGGTNHFENLDWTGMKFSFRTGDLWDAAGGVTASQRIQVTVNHPGGSSYTIWVG